MEEAQQGNRAAEGVWLWVPPGIVLVIGIIVLVVVRRMAQALIVLLVGLGGQSLQIVSAHHRTRDRDASIRRLERSVAHWRDALRTEQETAQTQAKSLYALIESLAARVGGGDQLGPASLGGLPSKMPENDGGAG